MIRAIFWAQWKSIRLLRFGAGTRGAIFSAITSMLWYGFWIVAAAGLASGLLAVKPFAEYRIVALSGRRGVPPRAVDDQVFTSEHDALHGVFLKRVQDLTDS